MRTLLIIALVICSVNVTWANTKMYNKLNKLYLSDRTKCLEQSKKLAKKKQFEAIPHYFMSTIQYDKSKETQTLKGSYLFVYRSVSHAARFEKLSKDNERSLVNWDEHIASLKTRSEKLISALNKYDMADLSSNLIENLQKVESLAMYFTPEQQEEDEFEMKYLAQHPTAGTGKIFSEQVDGHFYGMAKGSERVNSFDQNLEKDLINLINKARADKAIPAYFYNDDLTNAARYHAYDQGTQGYLNHASQDLVDGKLITVGTTIHRINQFYRGMAKGECIAAGMTSPEQVFNQWMKSQTHAEIIFDPSAKYIGVALVRVEGSPFEYYWVLTTGN